VPAHQAASCIRGSRGCVWMSILHLSPYSRATELVRDELLRGLLRQVVRAQRTRRASSPALRGAVGDSPTSLENDVRDIGERSRCGLPDRKLWQLVSVLASVGP
jgi:hypothetical protein